MKIHNVTIFTCSRQPTTFGRSSYSLNILPIRNLNISKKSHFAFEINYVQQIYINMKIRIYILDKKYE